MHGSSEDCTHEKGEPMIPAVKGDFKYLCTILLSDLEAKCENGGENGREKPQAKNVLSR
jgi:hypothetical protein